jgi:ankyrin repeat protein
VNVEQLRKQAKELVKAARTGDAEAVSRIRAHASTRGHPLLADAQLALARERGYPSWPSLVAAVEASVERFVLAATSRRRARAEEMLAARPEIERDRWARVVLGRGWDGDANEVGGPRQWPPLHYVCHSVFASVELARDLLARGANPNTYVAANGGSPVSVLYGAAGVARHPELTRVLLEAGADPNAEPYFGDALYHSTEAESPECLRVLLEHGAEPRGSNALARALDFDHPEHVRLLLEAGADVNEGALLAHAVRRGRGPEVLRLLAAHGAEIDKLGGEWSTPPEERRTAYQYAVLRGLDEHAATLEELGASTELFPDDLAALAVARGERPAGGLPDKIGHAAQEILVSAALNGHVDLVVDLVGPTFVAYAAGGGPAGTLLHHAAWVGNPDVALRLLERGADPAARSDGAEFETPLAWAVLGSQFWQLEGRDYVEVAELLVAAGAVLEPRFRDVADGPLAGWVEERL